jgi:hypothetical protein
MAAPSDPAVLERLERAGVGERDRPVHRRTLWWVRADGTGRILDTDLPEARDAIGPAGGALPDRRRAVV